MFTKAVIAVAIAILIPTAACAGDDPHEKYYGKRQPVIVFKGAPLCVSHGDVVVLARVLAMMPGCSKLTKDAHAFQYGAPDQGIVAVGAPDAPIFYTFQAAVEPAPH